MRAGYFGFAAFKMLAGIRWRKCFKSPENRAKATSFHRKIGGVTFWCPHILLAFQSTQKRAGHREPKKNSGVFLTPYASHFNGDEKT